MSGPSDPGVMPPDPGDHPPSGRLARPPSERYSRPVGAGPLAPRDAAGSAGAGRLARALASAIGAGIVMAAALIVVGGVLAERTGLLAISGIGGAAIGLLAAGAAVPRDGVGLPALARGQVARVAVALAVLAVVIAAIGTWAYGRLEGGVLDPLAYLWSVFGPFIPAEAAIAAIAAAWGASAGPVRSRS